MACATLMNSSTNEQSATISNNSINTFVDEIKAGQLVDAIKTLVIMMLLLIMVQLE